MKFAAVIAASIYAGNAFSKDAAFPESFDGLSPSESVYSCAQFFSSLVDLQIEGLRRSPRSQSFKNALREDLQMMNTVLLYKFNDISNERKSVAKAVAPRDVMDSPNDVMYYCIAVFNSLDSSLTPKFHKMIKDHSESDMRSLLKSIK